MKTIKVLKEHVRKPKPVFLFGFEIEGAYPKQKEIYQLLQSVYGREVDSDVDCSIDCSSRFEPIEIKTPPLPEKKAIEKLLILLEKLNRFGFITNRTCGFHVNISEQNIFNETLAEGQNVKKFCWFFGSRFPVSEWRKAFKRQRNYYCEWSRDYKRYFARHWRHMNNMLSDNCLDRGAIALDKMNSYTSRCRRIEIRIAGNKDYHKNKKLLQDYLDSIREHAYSAYYQTV